MLAQDATPGREAGAHPASESLPPHAAPWWGNAPGEPAEVPLRSVAADDAPSSRGGVFATYGVEWLQTPGIRANVVVTRPVVIAAPIDHVWNLVKQIDRYGEYSGDQVKASIRDGTALVRGSAVKSGMFPELGYLKGWLFGGRLSHTEGTVTHVDDELKALCWRRPDPLAERRAEHWQVLTSTDGGRVRYHSGLWLPGIGGRIVTHAVGNAMRAAFDETVAGLKAAAQRRPHQPAH